MPFLAALQVVLFVLWFVPPVAAVVPTFVFFLPAIIVGVVLSVVFVVGFVGALVASR